MEHQRTEPFTAEDMKDQLRSVLDATAGVYNIERIFKALIQRHGVQDLDEMNTHDFWTVVGQNIE
ncbi:hypothetical protein [Streptomyces sp. SID7909]|uniref:hypothetical protein n=1 Tax=Streptomyces sp. SID7909 TaxID=2706092 RepID=UPI0013B9A85D|nr:hypothetical protein [Streptomyces sp. SID7909]NEC08909.1 hypothetical protein [Streptomyces sp. SID7909]